MAIETFDTSVDNCFSDFSRVDILSKARSLNSLRSSYSLLRKSKDFSGSGSDALATWPPA